MSKISEIAENKALWRYYAYGAYERIYRLKAIEKAAIEVLRMEP